VPYFDNVSRACHRQIRRTLRYRVSDLQSNRLHIYRRRQAACLSMHISNVTYLNTSVDFVVSLSRERKANCTIAYSVRRLHKIPSFRMCLISSHSLLNASSRGTNLAVGIIACRRVQRPIDKQHRQSDRAVATIVPELNGQGESLMTCHALNRQDRTLVSFPLPPSHLPTQ